MPRSLLAPLLAMGLAASEALLIGAGANFALTVQGQPPAAPLALLLAMAWLPLAASAVEIGAPGPRRLVGGALSAGLLFSYLNVRFEPGWFAQQITHPGLPAWIALVSLATTLRGTAIANGRTAVRTSFATGAVLLFVFWLLWALSLAGREGEPPPLPVPLVGYFALTLPLLALERVQLVRRRSAAPDRRALTFTSASLAATVLVVAAVLALGALLAQGAGIFRDGILPYLAPLDGVIRLIAWPLGLLAGGLATFLRPFARPRTAPLGPSGGAGDPQRDATDPTVLLILGLLTVVIALTLLAVGLIWLVRRGRRPEEPAAVSTDERESLWNWREALRGFRRVPPGRLTWEELPGDDARSRVRRLYREFLATAAARRQLFRSAADTPLKFAAQVTGTVPEAGPALAVLTDAYMIARYADAALDESTVEGARAALRSVQSKLGAG